MARQLNYAKRAIVPVYPEKHDILPFQYQKPTSRLTYFISQSRQHEQVKHESIKTSVSQNSKTTGVKQTSKTTIPTTIAPQYTFLQETSTQHFKNIQPIQFSNHQLSFFNPTILLATQPPSSKSKLKSRVDKQNIDYLYKFLDIIEKDFTSLLKDSHLTHKSLKYLQTDVQTIFTVENYKTLRRLNILPNKDVLIGRKAFADAVEKSIYHLKLLHTDCELEIKRVKPIPEKLQVEVRYSFKGKTRLPKNEVVIDFIVKFNFSKSSKQVHLIEFTDKHVKCDKSYVDVLKTLGVMALPLFGLTDSISLLDESSGFREFELRALNFEENSDMS
jgi:hypothetical protein